MSGSVSVTAITSTPSSGSLDLGSTVTFTLTSSAAVQVTPANGGGEPALTLNNGSLAGYTGMDANGNLLFSYTVAAGESTPDLKVTGLNLNGATINSTGSLAFGAAASYPAPRSSASVVTDLNGDGEPDIVVSNDAADTVSVLFGDGQGGFGSPTTFPLNGGSYSTYTIAAADLNGDGKPDILAADGNDAAVTVLLNDGQGNLGSPTNYSDGTVAYTGYAIAVADLNGDGKQDVVAADSYTGTISVQLGDGQGGFGAATTRTVSSSTKGVAVADVDGDSKPDLVVTNTGTVSVLLGDGQGGFGAPGSYTTGSNANNGMLPAVADLNGDGKPDIVVPNRDDGTVSVLLNNGDGTFAPQTIETVGGNPIGDVVADVNGDGKPDIIVSQYNSISVLLGDGDGTFQPQATFAAGTAGTYLDTITAADVNGDGKPDLVASDYAGPVSVLANNSVAPNLALNASGLAALSGADTGDSIACYLRGTRIATPDGGEAAVENLRIGDRVTTLEGPKAVKWIGRRSYSGRFARGNKAVLPVRIRANALADDVPCRDLWVSPKHALLLDGVLIPAEVLVNGTSIAQEREVEVVEYFHVELDRHGILIAEGALAESFVDDDSRGMFHNAHEHAALYPGAPRVPARYCAPRREDGEQVEAVRRRLALRANPAARSESEGFGALRGNVDTLAGGRLHGWAQHAARPEVPVCLEVLLDGAVIARTLANRYRADLWHAGLGSGCHAFEVALPEALHAQAQRLHGTGLRVRRIADGAELPSPSWPVPGNACQHNPEQDCAA